MYAFSRKLLPISVELTLLDTIQTTTMQNLRSGRKRKDLSLNGECQFSVLPDLPLESSVLNTTVITEDSKLPVSR